MTTKHHESLSTQCPTTAVTVTTATTTFLLITHILLHHLIQLQHTPLVAAQNVVTNPPQQSNTPNLGLPMQEITTPPTETKGTSFSATVNVGLHNVLSSNFTCPRFRQEMHKYFCDSAAISCINRCGQVRSGDHAVCSCDGPCEMYRDCCYDYVEQCQPPVTKEWETILEESLDDISAICWNGVYLIPGKGFSTPDTLRDLREPLVTYKRTLHFITVRAYRSIISLPTLTARRLLSHDTSEWRREVYIRRQDVSLEKLEDFANSGQLTRFGIENDPDRIIIVDIPPEDVLVRECPGTYRYEAECKMNQNTGHCNLPKVFQFERPEDVNCLLQYDDSSDNGDDGDADDQENSHRKDSDADDNGKKIIKRGAKFDISNNSDTTISRTEQSKRSFGDTSTIPVSTSATQSMPTPDTSNAQTIQTTRCIYHTTDHPKATLAPTNLKRLLNVKWHNNLLLETETKRTNGELDELTIVEKTTQNVETNSIATSQGHPNHSNDEVNDKELEQGVTNEIKVNFSDSGSCLLKRVASAHESLKTPEWSTSKFVKIEFEPSIAESRVDMFLENTDSKIEKIVCTKKGSDMYSFVNRCSISIQCRQGLIPLGLECRHPAKATLQIFGSRNLTTQKAALSFFLSNLVSDHRDTFLLHGNWADNLSIRFHSQPYASEVIGYMPMKNSSSLRYSGESLPIRRAMKNSIQQYYLGFRLPQQPVVRAITICFVIEKMSDLPGGMICDRWYFDSNSNINCTEHFKLNGSVIPSAGRIKIPPQCLADLPASDANSCQDCGNIKHMLTAIMLLHLYVTKL